jgi:glycerol-3-phosphate acyltransferase PlsY
MATCTLRATAANGAIAATLAPGRAFQLTEVRLHLSGAGGATNLTATVDANAGAAYDLNIITQDMTAVVNYIWQPDFPMHFDSGDEIDFAFSNGNNRTYGLEVKYNLL